jgi:SAM-dependent methyltransferase
MIVAWEKQIFDDIRDRFERGTFVLDIGCGPGHQMETLCGQGCNAIGLDVDLSALAQCHAKGLKVIQAGAEQIPIRNVAVGAILCRVVLPYTREHDVIREIGRILKPGGRCYLSGHGAGYYLQYLLRLAPWKQRIYGLRSLINTWWRIVTGRALPGFWGDTLYQSKSRLNRYYRQNGLRLIQDVPGQTFLGFPVFINHIVEKQE